MKIIVEKAVIEQALEALEKTGIEGTWLLHDEAITALREALAEQAEQEPSCNQHPDAPHGFARNASHNAGRYVCECEGWEPEQEPVLRYAHIKCPVCDVENPGIHKCAAPVRTKDLTAKWIDPNDKSQKQYLPHIGEKVLFCCDGEVYYGHHTGGAFQKGYGVTKSLFPTWDCMWMPLPAAAVATDLEKNK